MLGGDAAHQLRAVLGGFALFVFSAAGAASGLLSQRLSAARLMTISPIALLAGLSMLAAAIAQSSVNMFMVGSAVLGAGFGTGFQGAIRSAVAQAGAQERAGVLSVLFIVSYLSMGVPSILAGYRLASSGDIRGTAEEFGIAMLVLAMAALAARLRSPR
jgi:MFS family permease